MGAELRKSRARFHELALLLAEIYGSNNQAAYSFARSVEAIDRLCADLQAQAARDWPGRLTDGIYT